MFYAEIVNKNKCKNFFAYVLVLLLPLIVDVYVI